MNEKSSDPGSSWTQPHYGFRCSSCDTTTDFPTNDGALAWALAEAKGWEMARTSNDAAFVGPCCRSASNHGSSHQPCG